MNDSVPAQPAVPVVDPHHNYKVALALLLKNIQEGNPRHEFVLEIAETPQLLIEKGGLPKLPLVIKGRAVDKIHFDHGMTKGMLERICDIACASTAIYQCQPDHPPGCVLVTQEVHLGNPVILVIQREKQIGRSLVANEVASMYSKRTGFEQRWKASGLLLWEK